MAPNSHHQILPFLSLPPELRDLIYLQSFSPLTPLDTAALRHPPDRLHLHPVTQLSRQTRVEALHVLSTARPVELSLHSAENARRARCWARESRGLVRGTPRVVLSGRLARCGFDFFRVVVEVGGEEVSVFRVRAREAACAEAREVVEGMRRKVLAFLEERVGGVEEGRQVVMLSGKLEELVEMVGEEADREGG